MKKIVTLAVLAAIVCPAFAEETPADAAAPGAAEPAAEVVDQIKLAEPEALPESDLSEPEPASNPKIKFPRGMQLGLGASATSGVNGFVGYANKNFESFWWKRLGVRFDFASTSPVKSQISSALDSAMSGGVDIGDLSIDSAAINARHFGAMVDFYPFGNTWFLGGWRLSGGYMTGKTNLSATLTGELSGAPGGGFEFELDGTDYKYTGNDMKAFADIDWKYSGPYLGTGFDLGLFWGIKIYMDAGVVFTSKTAEVGLDVPLTNLQVSDGAGGWNPVGSDPVLKGDLETAKANALAEANDELSKIKFYPMVKLGLMYRF